MSRISYVNGHYLPHYAASVHIEDRGYQFSDGVYEVVAIHQGKLIDMDSHMIRLMRSMEELEITWPVCKKAKMRPPFISRPDHAQTHIFDIQS